MPDVDAMARWLYERDERMWGAIRVGWDDENSSFKDMYREQIRKMLALPDDSERGT